MECVRIFWLMKFSSVRSGQTRVDTGGSINIISIYSTVLFDFDCAMIFCSWYYFASTMSWIWIFDCAIDFLFWFWTSYLSDILVWYSGRPFVHIRRVCRLIQYWNFLSEIWVDICQSQIIWTLFKRLFAPMTANSSSEGARHILWHFSTHSCPNSISIIYITDMDARWMAQWYHRMSSIDIHNVVIKWNNNSTIVEDTTTTIFMRCAYRASNLHIYFHSSNRKHIYLYILFMAPTHHNAFSSMKPIKRYMEYIFYSVSVVRIKNWAFVCVWFCIHRAYLHRW